MRSAYHGGDRAFYAIEPDRVQMPPFESFFDAESYYATLLHELPHYAVSRIMPYGYVGQLDLRCRPRGDSG